MNKDNQAGKAFQELLNCMVQNTPLTYKIDEKTKSIVIIKKDKAQ